MHMTVWRLPPGFQPVPGKGRQAKPESNETQSSNPRANAMNRAKNQCNPTFYSKKYKQVVHENANAINRREASILLEIGFTGTIIS